MDDESDWRKQLLLGLGVLVVVALLIGGIVGVIAVKAADVAGIGQKPSPETGVVIPSRTPTTSPSQSGTPTTGSETAPTAPTQPTPTKHRKPKPKGIELNASPSQAGTYQRVNLTGSYQAPPGTSLQVQRQEGGNWVDFPTSASVNGGQFSTYIETGHTGPNRFRVVDSSSGKSSNVVVVQIS